VLLYELLVGRPPFEPGQLARAGIDEVRRRVREEDPLKPSTRLQSIQSSELTHTAQRRGTSPPELLQTIQGDLDWIVMKAMEKERTRRYDTAIALAEDVAHFLNHEPVLARPPSTLYRIQKFARRNRVTFAAAVVMTFAAGAVFVVLTLGLVVSTWLFFRERDARQQAAAAKQEAALTQAEVLAFGNPELVERVTRARESQGQLKEATDLLNMGKLAQAEPLLDAMLQTPAGGGSFESAVRQMRADLRAREGRFEEAVEDLTRLIEIEPEDHWNWFILSPLWVEIGDEAAYQSGRLTMLKLFSHTEDALAAERVAKAALLRPLGESEPELIDALLETIATRGTREHYGDEFAQYLDGFKLCEALAEYRRGNYGRAIRSAEPVLGSSYTLFIPVSYAVLAMSHHHQQRPLEARAALDAGRKIAREQLPQLGGSDLGHLWNDVLIADILLKEAADLVESRPSGPPGAAPRSSDPPGS
jgi:tetratricopeptide (TPR) repeat protein